MAGRTYETNIRIGGQVSKSLANSVKAASGQLGGLTKPLKGLATAAAGVFAGMKIGGAIKNSVDKAMAFESSMADVAKVVDGLKDSTGQTTEAYAAMSKEILNMTSTLPMAAEEITQLIAAAGQSGIAANELTKFAEDAAKMGVAFDLPAERAGELAAVIRSSLGLTQDEFVVLADKINYFGNTTTQSADRLIEVVEATGLIGKQAGVNADQIAAMGAAMNGMDAANMSTALSNIYGSLMTGSGATKAANDAWKSLGFTSSQVAKDMLMDSEGTMIKIFEAMKKLPGDQLSATTAAIFGNNKSTKMAVASFTENLDALKQNFRDIGDVTEYAGSMQDEFNARAATTENTVQLAKNAIDRMQISLGDLLLPVVARGATRFADAVSGMTDKIPGLIGNIKGLTDGIKSSVGLDEIYEDLKPKLPLIKTSAKYFAMNFVGGVGKFLKGDSLSEAFSESMLGLKGVLTQTLGNETGGTVFEGIQRQLERISSFFEGVKDIIATVAPVASGYANNIVGIIKKLEPVADKINSSIITAIEMIAPVLGGILAEIMSNAGSIIDGIAGFVDAFAPVITNVIDTIMAYLPTILPVFQNVGAAIGNLVMRIGETLQILAPMFAGIFNFICKNVIPVAVVVFKNFGRVVCVAIDVIANTLPVVAAALVGVWQAIEPVLQVIVNVFQFAFGVVSGVIASAVEMIGEHINNILLVLSGVIDFVSGVFTGDWSKAWQGVQDIFAGAFGALSGLVKTPLNAVISIVNAAIDGINSLSVTVPDWVPGLGGQNFNLNVPKLPMLAKGTDNFSGGMAIVGERGPELVNMSRGSQVITNSKTESLVDAIRQLLDVSPVLTDNQSALRFAYEVDSGSVGGLGFTIEINPTVIIKGNADEAVIEKGVQSGIEKAVPMTMAQFEKMMRLYNQGRRRVSLG